MKLRNFLKFKDISLHYIKPVKLLYKTDNTIRRQWDIALLVLNARILIRWPSRDTAQTKATDKTATEEDATDVRWFTPSLTFHLGMFQTSPFNSFFLKDARPAKWKPPWWEPRAARSSRVGSGKNLKHTRNEVKPSTLLRKKMEKRKTFLILIRVFRAKHFWPVLNIFEPTNFVLCWMFFSQTFSC